jgi:hypothetical protein
MKKRIRNYISFLAGLQRFLNQPISFEEAKAIFAQRMEQREKNFLNFVKRCVYDNPSSPYIPLLRQAECDYGDMISGVHRYGIEGLLKMLNDAGVWISFDEFKGRKMLCRGGKEYYFSTSDFDNPLVSSGCEITTGGTSGRPIRSHLYLDFLAARACYDHFMFKMLDIYGTPLALWYPKLPAPTGIGNSLRYAKIGYPPKRWFNMLADSRIRSGWELRMATSAIILLSRLSTTPLPLPQDLSLSQVGTIVDWIIETRKRYPRCVVQSYVSQAVRICQSAADRGVDLEGTLFIVGSEPLTEAKYREIEKVYANVFPRYHATEIGSIAIGCGKASEVGDLHLCADTIAMIQTEDSSNEGNEKTFHFTSFIDYAPKIMINVEIGDTGIVQKNRCGCLLDEIGFDTHLLRVQSLSRVTSEGTATCYRELLHIIEDVLPAKYGGTSIDYQWVEVEDNSSLTRLLLRVAPHIGPVKEADIVNDILAELRQIDMAHRIYSEIWHQAGTIRIVRQNPHHTSAGKIVPIIQERKLFPQLARVK